MIRHDLFRELSYAVDEVDGSPTLDLPVVLAEFRYYYYLRLLPFVREYAGSEYFAYLLKQHIF